MSNRTVALGRFPSFNSSFPPYARTPSPSSVPRPPGYPFRVPTPPSSTYTSPSRLSARFPASPISPTSQHRSQVNLPPISSIFKDGRVAGSHKGKTSPSKARKSRTIEYAGTTKRREIEKKAPGYAGGNNDGEGPLQMIQCGWPGCTWIGPLIDANKLLNIHLNAHYLAAEALETVKDGKVTCRWNGNCGRRVRKAGIVTHSRATHCREFMTKCSVVGCGIWVTSGGPFELHLENHHGGTSIHDSVTKR